MFAAQTVFPYGLYAVIVSLNFLWGGNSTDTLASSPFNECGLAVIIIGSEFTSVSSDAAIM